MDEGVKMVLAICHLFEDLKATHLSGPTPMSFADNAGGLLGLILKPLPRKCNMSIFKKLLFAIQFASVKSSSATFLVNSIHPTFLPKK
jgi:hypothetical protein